MDQGSEDEKRLEVFPSAGCGCTDNSSLWDQHLPVPCRRSGQHRTLGTNWKPDSWKPWKLQLMFCYFQLFILSFPSLKWCKWDTSVCLTGTNLRYKIISSVIKFFLRKPKCLLKIKAETVGHWYEWVPWSPWIFHAVCFIGRMCKKDPTLVWTHLYAVIRSKLSHDSFKKGCWKILLFTKQFTICFRCTSKLTWRITLMRGEKG